MRRLRSQFVRALALLLVAGAVALPASAQRGIGQGKKKGEGQRAEANGNAPSREVNKERRDLRKMVGLPPRWMERLQEMSPEEQERFLSNNEHFKSLPAERQGQIRKRLQQWNSLTPEQRAALRERERVWRQMTPEQKQYVREQLLPKWQQLPPERRRVLLGKLSELRPLNDSGRTARLKDEAFLKGLSPDERTMLRDLSNLRVGPPGEPPPGNP